MSFIEFQPSQHLMDFHLAGFAYGEGLDVIDELKLGQEVQLAHEVHNPHDPQAIAVLYQGRKIGYVPSAKNDILYSLIYFGHGHILRARIQMVDPQTHPERQFRVAIFIADHRQKGQNV